jgi:CBS domain-containing protein
MTIYARDLMTAPAITIGVDASIEEAVKLMLDKRLSGLPVVDSAQRLVGVLTEGDLLRRSELGTTKKRPRWLEIILGPGSVAMDYVREHGRRIGEIMTEDPATISEDASISEIVALMEKRHVKRLPVVRGETVVGVVARADLIRGLAQEKLRVVPRTDAEIRDRIIADLRAQKWAPVGLIGVTVDHGEVHLNGAILDERERNAIKVVAENAPGVLKVHDHLAWVGPEGLYVEPPPEKA